MTPASITRDTRKFRRCSGSLVAIALAAGLCAGAAHATQAPTTEVFDFTGTCSDCSGVATAVLTLQDFTSGWVSASQFVSFSYQSNLTSFTVTTSDLDTKDFIALLIPSEMPWDTQVEVGLANGPNSTSVSFDSFMTGNWTVLGPSASVSGILVGARRSEDIGVNGVWSAASLTSSAPEPASWALMILGFGGLGAMLRTRRRTLGVIETA
jgi:hypothetical protein